MAPCNSWVSCWPCSFVFYICMWLGVRVMVFNATFNNMSVILLQALLLLEETAENHIKLHWVHLAMWGFKLTFLVVIGTDSTHSCKSNYITIMTTVVPSFMLYVCTHVSMYQFLITWAQSGNIFLFIIMFHTICFGSFRKWRTLSNH